MPCISAGDRAAVHRERGSVHEHRRRQLVLHRRGFDRAAVHEADGTFIQANRTLSGIQRGRVRNGSPVHRERGIGTLGIHAATVAHVIALSVLKIAVLERERSFVRHVIRLAVAVEHQPAVDGKRCTGFDFDQIIDGTRRGGEGTRSPTGDREPDVLPRRHNDLRRRGYIARDGNVRLLPVGRSGDGSLDLFDTRRVVGERKAAGNADGERRKRERPAAQPLGYHGSLSPEPSR